jgi:hypothetical protein
VTISVVSAIDAFRIAGRERIVNRRTLRGSAGLVVLSMLVASFGTCRQPVGNIGSA